MAVVSLVAPDLTFCCGKLTFANPCQSVVPGQSGQSKALSWYVWPKSKT
jgi:hypothetical protein